MSMSYGLPVVASAILPFEEVIDDGINGLLFEKGNSQDLATKINKLFNDKNLINSIPKKAINHMKNHYNWDPIAEGYLDILKLI